MIDTASGGGQVSQARQVALAVLLTLVAVGCGQASSREAFTSAAAGEHRLGHVHGFPPEGIRIAPPTGTPRLSWRQARAAAEEFYGDWGARTPPQVKLADYRDRLRGLARPVLAWVVVYPEAEIVDHGPDFAPPPARVQRCPVYVGVDATGGRLLGALQACDPPYQG
jgi:hypothetical protein